MNKRTQNYCDAAHFREVVKVLYDAVERVDISAVLNQCRILPQTNETMSVMFDAAEKMIDKLIGLSVDELGRQFAPAVSVLIGIGMRKELTKEHQQDVKHLAQRLVWHISDLSRSQSDLEACRKAVWVLSAISCLPGADGAGAVGFLQREYGHLIGQLGAEELSRLASALSRLGRLKDDLSQIVADASMNLIQDFSIVSLVALLISFSFSRVQKLEQLLDAASNRLRGGLSQVSNKNLAQLCGTFHFYNHTALAGDVHAEFSIRILDTSLRDGAPILHYLSSNGLLDKQLLSDLRTLLEKSSLAGVHPTTLRLLFLSLATAPEGHVRDEVLHMLIRHIPTDLLQANCFGILRSLQLLRSAGHDGVPDAVLDWLLARMLSEMHSISAYQLCCMAWLSLSLRGQSVDRFLKEPDEAMVSFLPASPDSITSVCSALRILRLRDCYFLRSAISEASRHLQSMQDEKEHLEMLLSIVHTVAVLREKLLHQEIRPFAKHLGQHVKTLPFGDQVTFAWSVISSHLLAKTAQVPFVTSVLSSCPDELHLSEMENLELQELGWWLSKSAGEPVVSAADDAFSKHVQHATRTDLDDAEIENGLKQLQRHYKPGSCQLRVQLRGGPHLHAAILLDQDFLPHGWAAAGLDPTDMDQQVAQRRRFTPLAVFVLGEDHWLYMPEKEKGEKRDFCGSMMIIRRTLMSVGWKLLLLNRREWLAESDKAKEVEEWRLSSMLGTPVNVNTSDSKHPVRRARRTKKPLDTVDDEEEEATSLAAGYSNQSANTSRSRAGKQGFCRQTSHQQSAIGGLERNLSPSSSPTPVQTGFKMKGHNRTGAGRSSDSSYSEGKRGRKSD